MKVSVEVSMYPLDENYIPPILEFIEKLNAFPNISVRTNSMSTQVFGDYDEVMDALKEAMRHSFSGERKVSMVMKVINSDLDYVYKG